MPRVRIPQRIWSPPGHWKLFAFYMLVLLAVVGFQGFATHTVGQGTEGSNAASAPLLGARPILVAHGSRLAPVAPPAGRRVALTFDDGPNPRWTPQIAGELRRAGVHGTFFLVGSQAARYPGLVRELVRDGDELGNHTFTHVFLSAVPAWEGHLQIELTEAVISGITGHYTRLLRPPYSATPDAVNPHDERTLAELAGSRLLRGARQLRLERLEATRGQADRRQRDAAGKDRRDRDAPRRGRQPLADGHRGA